MACLPQCPHQLLLLSGLPLATTCPCFHLSSRAEDGLSDWSLALPVYEPATVFSMVHFVQKSSKSKVGGIAAGAAV